MTHDYPSRPFPETRLSLMDRVRLGDATALEELARCYWPAILAATRRGWHDQRGESPEDLAQEVTAKICRPAHVLQWNSDRGKFRSWILGVVQHVISEHTRRARAIKRGGRVEHVPIDALKSVSDPSAGWEEEFDRAWARVNLTTAKVKVRAEWAAEGKAERFDRLIVSAMLGNSAPETHDDLARSFGVTRSAISGEIRRLYLAVVDAFAAACRQTCGSDAEARSEVEYLAGKLLRPGPRRKSVCHPTSPPNSGDADALT